MTEPSLPEEAIFLRALEIESAAERAAYLDQACGENRELRAGVEALLRANEKKGDLLDLPEEPGPTDENKPETEQPGMIIGHYHLHEEIGKGGMGVVYCATDTRLKREVAVKLIRATQAAEAGAKNRFIAEAQIASQLQHPNIPPVHELGELPDGQPFLAMKLVKGRKLHDLLKERPDPSHERGRFIAIFEQVCHAVGYAHAHHVLHRDLKPSNVMVGAHGEVQVMDWGLAKVLDPSREGERPEDDAGPRTTVTYVTAIETPKRGDSATRTGSILGTLAYMPPEQAAGEIRKLDSRSDVFGLGAILCEILTGQPPYRGQNDYEMQLEAVRGETGEAFARLDACGVEPDLIKLCKRCLAFKQEDRPADGKALAAEVAGIRQAAEERARQAELERERARIREAEERKRRRQFLTAAGVIVAILSAGAALATWQAVRATHAEKLATEKQLAAENSEAEAKEQKRQADEARENELRQLYAADMLLASRAAAEGPLARAIDLLDTWLPERREGKDYRGREWHLLRRLCNTSDKTLLGHNGPLRALAWSTDGKRLASGGADRIIRVWDAETGLCLQTLIGHSDGVFDVAFSPDGKLLASASADCTVRLWDVESGKERLVLRGHILPVYAVAFHPDGKQLSTAGGDCVIKVWDTTSGTELFTLQRHEAAIGRLQFDAAGKKLASSGIIRGTMIWDLETRKVINRLVLNGDLVFTPDLATAIFAYPRGEFGVVDVKARTVDQGALGLSEIYAIDTDRTARIVAISGNDDTIRIIDRDARSTLVTHRGHLGPARRVILRADARKLASAGDDGSVRIWNVPDPNQPLPYSRHHEHNVTAVAFSQDGTLLASGDYLGSIAVWNSRTGTRTRILGSHYLRRKSQQIPLEIGTGKPMEKGKIPLKHYTKYQDSPTSRDPIVECFTSYGHGGEVKGVAFTPDKKTLVSAGAQDLIVWDLNSAKPVKVFEHPTLVSSLAVSPDGALAATGCWDDIVRIFHVPSGELAKQLEGHGDDVMCVAFHPSGKELATGGRDQTVIVWDVETGKIKHRLRRHVNTVFAVRYSPDGKRLLTGGMDKAIHVWNADTGEYEATLHGHNEGVTSLAVSSDGKWLVSASDGTKDTQARIWLWNPSRFREGALIKTLGSKGPSALAIHPVTGDILLGRRQLTTYETKPLFEAPPTTAEHVAPEVLRAKAPTDDRLKVLGYALVEEIGTWPDAKKRRLKPSQPGGKFLVIATSLPFRRLKLSDADYWRLLDVKRKDPDATEPLKFSSMLIYPQRFVLLTGSDGKPLPAHFVGRMAKSQQEGFEFMNKGCSMLENPTAKPQLDDRQHVYLGWEVAGDFSAKGLRLRFENDEPVSVPRLELETFRPGKPFHPRSRGFEAGEGETRLRAQTTRSPGP